MRPRSAIAAAYVMCAASVTFAVWVAAVGVTRPTATFAGFGGGTAAGELESVIINLGGALLGVLLTVRRPENPVGLGLLVISVTFLSSPAVVLGVELLQANGHGNGLAASLVAWFGNWLWVVGQAAIVLMLLVFPTGRLLPRWRPVLLGAMAISILTAVVAMLADGPLDLAPWLDNPFGVPLVGTVFEPLLLLLLACVVLSVVSLLIRFARSRGEERLQLRWVAYGAALFGAALAIQASGLTVLPWVDSAGAAALLTAIAFAVAKYRLYDIDRLISRTFSYAVLTVIVVGVYLAVVTLLTQITSSVAGRSPLAVASSTLAAAAIIGPARRRIQDLVDRRFNRARFDAVAAAEAYRARLRDELELDALTRGLVDVVNSTVEPKRVGLWLRPVEAAIR